MADLFSARKRDGKMEISAVKLRNSYQIYYIDTNNIFVNQNTMCVVETEHGVDVGAVVKTSSYQNNQDIAVKGKLLRKLTSEDEEKMPEIEEIEKNAFSLCREKAKFKNLDMKLVSVKCLFDKTKIIFYFVAENRIDFRELVRELAAVFRTRIEMRQIGVRDEARLVGGYGPCGRPLCCVHQREEFEPVSIKMAKEQNLNLNSLKISGMCGRLLCCLGYEYNTYRELNVNMPRYGAEILARERVFHVISYDTLDESLRIRSGDSILKISKHDLVRKGEKYIIKEELVDQIINSENEDPSTEED